MVTPLEQLYRSHHASARGEDFALLGNERGAFLKEQIGTHKQVLDIGCRDGALTRYYAQENTVMGIDIDSVALTKAKKDLNIQTAQIDLNGDWGIPHATYDAVVACEILEHLYYPHEVIQKVSRVLKPGGLFIGSVPNAFSLANRLRYLRVQKKFTPLSDPTHINHFIVAELEGLLKESFDDVHVYGYGRHAWLARTFPQLFAFGLLWSARAKA